MDKKSSQYQYTKTRNFRAWPLLVVSLVCLMVGVYGLRQNNLEMVRLRQAVIEADEKNEDVEQALYNLRSYVYTHMNTNLASGDFAIKPPIQLKYQYERLASQEAKRVKTQNKSIQAKGEAICARKHPGAGFNSPRVACIADYMKIHAVTESSVPSELYKFDFISPRWSPDLAGLALLGSVIFFILFILRLIVIWWHKRMV